MLWYSYTVSRVEGFELGSSYIRARNLILQIECCYYNFALNNWSIGRHSYAFRIMTIPGIITTRNIVYLCQRGWPENRRLKFQIGQVPRGRAVGVAFLKVICLNRCKKDSYDGRVIINWFLDKCLFPANFVAQENVLNWAPLSCRLN